jgi:aspartyl/asparaginyl beta-hydroxylase
MNAQLQPPPIYQIAQGLPVAELVAQIEANPDVWNRHTMRTEAYETPHNEVSDIWVRYNAWENFTGDPQAFNGPHESVWYPVVEQIPAVVPLVADVMLRAGLYELGGVLITKIPPGAHVAPHIDTGWHAAHYMKFAVQLLGGQDQEFWFEEAQLSPEAGDLYTFDNAKLHAVYNRSDRDRMTCIICLR